MRKLAATQTMLGSFFSTSLPASPLASCAKAGIARSAKTRNSRDRLTQPSGRGSCPRSDLPACRPAPQYSREGIRFLRNRELDLGHAGFRFETSGSGQLRLLGVELLQELGLLLVDLIARVS